MGFAGVSVATLGIGFQANAGEKTWDFETDPFDEFLISPLHKRITYGVDKVGMIGEPKEILVVSSPSPKQPEAPGPLPSYLTLTTVNLLKPST